MSVHSKASTSFWNEVNFVSLREMKSFWYVSKVITSALIRASSPVCNKNIHASENVPQRGVRLPSLSPTAIRSQQLQARPVPQVLVEQLPLPPALRWPGRLPPAPPQCHRPPPPSSPLGPRLQARPLGQIPQRTTAPPKLPPCHGWRRVCWQWTKVCTALCCDFRNRAVEPELKFQASTLASRQLTFSSPASAPASTSKSFWLRLQK